MERDFNVILGVVELDIDVLGPGPHLWNLGNFDSTAVVLKDLAMYHWLGGDHVVTLSLQLLDKLHDWNCCTECSQQTYELALSAAECYFCLELQCPRIG